MYQSAPFNGRVNTAYNLSDGERSTQFTNRRGLQLRLGYGLYRLVTCLNKGELNETKRVDLVDLKTLKPLWKKSSCAVS